MNAVTANIEIPGDPMHRCRKQIGSVKAKLCHVKHSGKLVRDFATHRAPENS